MSTSDLSADDTTRDVERWAFGLSIGVLVLSVLAHAARARSHLWMPIADNGWWALMSRSVLSSHPPLLGSSSSGGLEVGSGFHHLGPIGFYLMAPFVAVFGDVGLAVGAGVLNAAAVLVGVVAARAALGRVAGWVSLIGASALALAMGSELLVDPLNPHLIIMVLYAGCLFTWVIVSSHSDNATVWAIPGVVALSIAMQTHLSAVPVAGALGAVLLAGTALRSWRRSTAGGRAWRDLIISVVVGLVMWAPTLVQQFFGSGPGNLSAAIEGSASQGDQIGLGAGLRMFSSVLPWPSRWLPGAFGPQMTSLEDLGNPLVVVLLAGILVLLAVSGLRRRDRLALGTAGLCSGLVLVSVWLCARLPIRYGGVVAGMTRWIWPVAMFVQVACITVAFSWLLQAVRGAERTRPTRAVGGCLAATAVLALVAANVAWRNEGSGSTESLRRPTDLLLDRLAPQLAEVERPHVLTVTSWMSASALSGVLVRLDELGVDFSLDDPVVLRQVGQQRAVDGSERSRLIVRGGSAVLDPVPDGFDELGLETPLTAGEVSDYRALSERADERLAQLSDDLRRDPELAAAVLRPGADQEVLAAAGWQETMCGVFSQLDVKAAAVSDRVLPQDDRDRLCELHDRLEAGSIAVLVGPP